VGGVWSAARPLPLLNAQMVVLACTENPRAACVAVVVSRQFTGLRGSEGVGGVWSTARPLPLLIPQMVVLACAETPCCLCG
jgi:hypothetical protein